MLFKCIRLSLVVGLAAGVGGYITLYFVLGLSDPKSPPGVIVPTDPLMLAVFSMIYAGLVAFSCGKALFMNKGFVYGSVANFNQVAGLCVGLVAVIHVGASLIGIGLMAWGKANKSSGLGDLCFALGAAIILGAPSGIFFLDKVIQVLLVDRAFSGMQAFDEKQRPVPIVVEEARREAPPGAARPPEEKQDSSTRPSKRPPRRD